MQETQAERLSGYLKKIQKLQESSDLLDERTKKCQELLHRLIESIESLFWRTWKRRCKAYGKPSRMQGWSISWRILKR